MYQFGHFVYERHVPVHSTHSRTRSLSLVQTQKQIGQWRAYSFTTFSKSHAPSHLILRRVLAQSLVILWQDETVHRANSTALLRREGFQWTRNMSQWITRTIRSSKRFIQKERFVHERNITTRHYGTFIPNLLSQKEGYAGSLSFLGLSPLE